jgi:hypothetical protein
MRVVVTIEIAIVQEMVIVIGIMPETGAIEIVQGIVTVIGIMPETVAIATAIMQGTDATGITPEIVTAIGITLGITAAQMVGITPVVRIVAI